MERKGFEGVVSRGLDQISSEEFALLLKQPPSPSGYNPSGRNRPMTLEADMGLESEEDFVAELQESSTGQANWLKIASVKSAGRNPGWGDKPDKFGAYTNSGGPIILGSMDELEVRKRGIKATW